MATIRISSLPEIKVDRITDDDYYIVNDGDITTSKVSFRQIVLGIGERDIEFSGDVEFSGTVNLGGDVTGDFYNKNETYSKIEVDAIVAELEDYNTFQDERIVPLIELSGEDEKSSYYRDFQKGIIRPQATTRAALTDLEIYVADNRTLIEGLTDNSNDLQGELSSLEFRVETLELKVTDLRTDVNLLQSTVTDHGTELNQHEIDIELLKSKTNDHELRIVNLETLSSDNSDKVNALIRLSGVPSLSNDLGTFTGSTISDNARVKNALQDLETELELKAPIDNPVFTTKITAPSAVANKVPVYYNAKASLPVQGSTSYAEGEFAYAENEKAGYVSTSLGWLQILAFDDADPLSFDRTQLFRALGYTAAYSTEVDAAANGIDIGDTYVYSATNSLADGIIKTNMFTNKP